MSAANKYVITSDPPWLSELRARIQAGDEVVPLLGAGISAVADVPTLNTMQPYLRLCLLRVLGVDCEWLKTIETGEASEDSTCPVANAFKATLGKSDAAVSSPLELGKTVYEQTGFLLFPFSDQSSSKVGTPWREYRPWNPRLDPWPRFDVPPHGKVAARRSEFRLKVLDGLAAWSAQQSTLIWQEKAPSNLKSAWEQYADITREAAGAAADWRTILDLLSRLLWRNLSVKKSEVHVDKSTEEHNENEKPSPTVYPNQYWHIARTEFGYQVTDGFFAHTTRGKPPSAAHRILAGMTDVLRIRLTLTTNFEDLYERACQDAGVPVSVFEVPMSAGMPHPSLLRRESRSLVKMHGSRQGLLADHSLDAPPSLDDTRHFVGYLLGRAIPRDEWDDTTTSHQLRAYPDLHRHLFLIGVSGADYRIRSLVKAAMRRLPGLKVWWYCYDGRDSDAVKTFRVEIEDFDDRKDGNTNQRVFDVEHNHLPTFLGDTHQRLSYSLARTGSNYPAMWRDPIPATPNLDDLARRRLDGVNNLETISKLKYCFGEINVLRLEDNPDPNPFSDIAAAELLYEYWSRVEEPGKLENKSSKYPGDKKDTLSCRVKLWIELDDVGNGRDLYDHVAEAICRTAGKGPWIPPTLDGKQAASPRDLGKQLAKLLPRDRSEWFIFLNGAEAPAEMLLANVDDIRDQLDPTFEPRLESGPRECLKQAIELLGGLIEEAKTRVTGFVSLPAQYTPEQEVQEETIRWNGFQKYAENRSNYYQKKIDILFDNYAGYEQGQIPLEFLIGFTSFWQVRYPTSLVIRGVTTDPSDNLVDIKAAPTLSKSYENAETYCKILDETLGLLLWKRNSYGWLHQEVRNAIFKRARKLSKNLGENLPSVRFASIEQSIADWYLKLFHISNDPLALLESLRHRVRKMHIIAEMMSEMFTEACDRGEQAQILNIERWREKEVDLHAGIREIVHGLRRGTRRMVDTGYTAGTCLRLTSVKSELIQLIDNYCDEGVEGVEGVEGGKKYWLPLQITREARYAIARCIEAQFDVAKEVNHSIKMDERADELLEQAEKIKKIESIIARKVRDLHKKEDPTVENDRQIRKAKKHLREASRAIRNYELDDTPTPISDAHKVLMGSELPGYFTCDYKEYWHSHNEDSYTEHSLEYTRLNLRTAVAGRYNSPKFQRATIKMYRRLMNYMLLVDELSHIDCNITKADRYKVTPKGRFNSEGNAPLYAATAAYHHAAEILRLDVVGEGRDSFREHYRIRTFMGLISARLGHFHNARKRLSEASAFLVGVKPGSAPLDEAIIATTQARVEIIEVRATAKAQLNNCLDVLPQNCRENSSTGTNSVVEIFDGFILDQLNGLSGDALNKACDLFCQQTGSLLSQLRHARGFLRQAEGKWGPQRLNLVWWGQSCSSYFKCLEYEAILSLLYLKAAAFCEASKSQREMPHRIEEISDRMLVGRHPGQLLRKQCDRMRGDPFQLSRSMDSALIAEACFRAMGARGDSEHEIPDIGRFDSRVRKQMKEVARLLRVELKTAKESGFKNLETRAYWAYVVNDFSYSVSRRCNNLPEA